MRSFLTIMIWFASAGYLSPLWGQTLVEKEKALSRQAEVFISEASLDEKLNVNKAFTKSLIQILKQGNSFKYPFDSLTRVSHITAEDQSFRIFTWQIIDRPSGNRVPETYHYYFGLIQRKWRQSNGSIEWVVIPLIEMQSIPTDVENQILTSNNWLGGIYYPPRFAQKFTSQTIKFTDPENGTKVKQNAYVLFGWNGFDQSSNIKFVDILTLDPNVKDKVYFGADIFYFDAVPKFRAVFRYSDNAPFNLNYGYVKNGPFNLFKKKMIVFDHLAPPTQGRRIGGWNLGPDGSYDALNFYRAGGYYEWKRDINIATQYNNKITRRSQQQQREAAQRQLEEAGIYLPENP